MNKTYYSLILLSLFCFCVSCTKTTIYPYWEIPDPHLTEIAMVRADPNWGSAVIYNPESCERIGKACLFFKLHANSHTILEHTLLAKAENYPLSQEQAADCYAAKYGESAAVYAAVEFLLDKPAQAGLKIHGEPLARAKLIQQCAEENNNWPKM